MDIAKIRKKAQEKEAREKAEKRPEEAAEAPEATSPGSAPEPSPEEPATEAAGETEGGGGAAEEAGERPTETEGAKRPEEGEAPHIVELLTFTLDREEFAFSVPEVEEIIRYQKITAVPTMPVYVCGITSLRGKIIPVIDLKARLILRDKTDSTDADRAAEETCPQGDKKILILSGPRGLIGATIDRVLGVVRLPVGSIFEPPAHLSEEELRYIEGVVTVDNRFISIIRSEAALTIEVT